MRSTAHPVLPRGGDGYLTRVRHVGRDAAGGRSSSSVKKTLLGQVLQGRPAQAPHREHRQQVLHIVSAAEACGQSRLVEMNRQVADNLTAIIAALEDTTGDV
jgi:hypothetical protein